MLNSGIAVIDFETTGLFPSGNDRAVEVGVLLLNADLEVEHEFETLINPMRDLGASRIHKIEAKWLVDAPTFSEVLPHLSLILAGRVLVAHNARFDIDFLIHEFRRAGIPIAIDEDSYLCTMQLSKWVLPGQRSRSLESLTAHFDIPNKKPHAAYGDAEATASLLRKFSETKPELKGILGGMTGVNFSAAESQPETARPLKARPDGTTLQEPTFIERLVSKLSPVSTSPIVDDYLALLGRALLDGVLSESEIRDLLKKAEELSLSVDDVEAAHTSYFRSLAAQAWEDGMLTEFEVSELTSIAKLLGIGDIEVEAVKLGAPLVEENTQIQANPLSMNGILVALTGDMDPPKSVLRELLLARGLVPVDSISKKVSVLIAADPDSMSGKALAARKNGIPIISAHKAHAYLTN